MLRSSLVDIFVDDIEDGPVRRAKAKLDKAERTLEYGSFDVARSLVEEARLLVAPSDMENETSVPTPGFRYSWYSRWTCWLSLALGTTA